MELQRFLFFMWDYRGLYCCSSGRQTIQHQCSTEVVETLGSQGSFRLQANLIWIRFAIFNEYPTMIWLCSDWATIFNNMTGLSAPLERSALLHLGLAWQKVTSWTIKTNCRVLSWHVTTWLFICHLNPTPEYGFNLFCKIWLWLFRLEKSMEFQSGWAKDSDLGRQPQQCFGLFEFASF